MAPRAKDAFGPPNDGSNSDKPQPTSNEAFLFFTLIKNMRGKPDIDWEQVAIDNGFKNAETAKVRFGQIKRKLGLNDANAQGATPTPRAPRGGGRGKKGATLSSPLVSSPAGAAQVGAGPEDESEHISDVLGPSPSGIKKVRTKRNARPKTEDFASGENFATPTKAKKALRKAAVKTEEEIEGDSQTMLPPHVVNDDGDGPMELDEENSLGRITPSTTRCFKPDPEDESMSSQNVPVHPVYLALTLAPIPGTTGVAQRNNYFPVHGGGNDYDFESAIQPGPIRERNWNDDDGGAIGQLRQDVLTNNNGQDKLFHRAIKNAPTRSQSKPADSVSFQQEVNLSSMMAGGLPGGGSSGSYGTSQAAQAQGQWSRNNEFDNYGNSLSIFGDGSGSRKGGDAVDDYDHVGRI